MQKSRARSKSDEAAEPPQLPHQSRGRCARRRRVRRRAAARRAAEPVNIGALYPTTGSMAQIGVGCVAAAKLAVEMVNEAGGIKSLGGAKLNLIISDVQSDTTVTRTETDRLITGNKLSAIHGCFASALTLIASEVAERAKVPLITGSSSDQLNKGRHLYLHAVRARLAVRARRSCRWRNWSATSRRWR